MGLDNVAVQWPRTGRFYDPVAPAEFVDFGDLADKVPDMPGPAAALADHIAKTGTVRATGYTELVDLLLGLGGVLYATEAAAEDEDPVIDPDGCAWIAGGLERFVDGHIEFGEEVTFESVGDVLRAALEGSRLAEQQLNWLESRLDALRDESGEPPQWSFTRTELQVLAGFYRRCADRGFAVYADF
jgi:Arc/MetJ-type ribon-helix-helix transcriptional regulator